LQEYLEENLYFEENQHQKKTNLSDDGYVEILDKLRDNLVIKTQALLATVFLHGVYHGA
jgi:predicted ATP-dependent Lon-type protease